MRNARPRQIEDDAGDGLGGFGTRLGLHGGAHSFPPIGLKQQVSERVVQAAVEVDRAPALLNDLRRAGSPIHVGVGLLMIGGGVGIRYQYCGQSGRGQLRQSGAARS